MPGRLANKNISQHIPDTQSQSQIKKHTGTVLGWRTLATQRPSSVVRKRRRILGILSIILLIMLIFTTVRLAAVASATNDELFVHIGNQQTITLDLRQSLPIDTHILGANVFPQFGVSSQDDADGLMNYSPPLTTGLKEAHIKLLRFPGGKWGEDHFLSLDQLISFSILLQQVNADGMIQARLSGPIKGNFSELTGIETRADVAGRWVDFLNNPHSDQRIGKHAHAPFYPVKYWTVGNEPDTLINPATGQKYLVKDYVNDFIQFSTAMHKSDPTIKVFGPEISEYYGSGPVDANGQLWMEGFLKGVGEYEKAHHVVLLDGVSFHRYPFADATQAPYMFLSSTGEWNYLLPTLHQLISQNMQRDLPIAVTEINSNLASQHAPSRGLAALWWADTLGTLMNQQVAYVAFASASGVTDTQYPLFTSDDQQPTPMFRVMQIFSHLQPNLIPLEVQRDPVSFYATRDNSGQAVSLLFINKASTSQLAQINTANTFFHISPWNSLDISLAGYSLVMVTLHRNSTAEAYSFAVPTSKDISTPQLIHTICGHKADPLADAIPC